MRAVKYSSPNGYALIVGHRDLNPQKPCPCFDAAHEYFGV